MTSAVQKWVSGLSAMQQSVLLSAIRGPDGIAKQHKCKNLIRWYRRCVLVSAFDKEILDNPGDPRGGSFSGPSISERTDNWELSMVKVSDDFMDSRDELPFHYFVHFMHASEVLGYKHPDERIRAFWRKLYLRICKALHLQPESEEIMDTRLGDSYCDWKDLGDESLSCSD